MEREFVVATIMFYATDGRKWLRALPLDADPRAKAREVGAAFFTELGTLWGPPETLVTEWDYDSNGRIEASKMTRTLAEVTA